MYITNYHFKKSYAVKWLPQTVWPLLSHLQTAVSKEAAAAVCSVWRSTLFSERSKQSLKRTVHEHIRCCCCLSRRQSANSNAPKNSAVVNERMNVRLDQTAIMKFMFKFCFYKHSQCFSIFYLHGRNTVYLFYLICLSRGLRNTLISVP